VHPCQAPLDGRLIAVPAETSSIHARKRADCRNLADLPNPTFWGFGGKTGQDGCQATAKPATLCHQRRLGRWNPPRIGPKLGAHLNTARRTLLDGNADRRTHILPLKTGFQKRDWLDNPQTDICHGLAWTGAWAVGAHPSHRHAMMMICTIPPKQGRDNSRLVYSSDPTGYRPGCILVSLAITNCQISGILMDPNEQKGRPTAHPFSLYLKHVFPLARHGGGNSRQSVLV
jgi:hypothetical protein